MPNGIFGTGIVTKIYARNFDSQGWNPMYLLDKVKHVNFFNMVLNFPFQKVPYASHLIEFKHLMIS